jgi:hypothetical protein
MHVCDLHVLNLSAAMINGTCIYSTRLIYMYVYTVHSQLVHVHQLLCYPNILILTNNVIPLSN